MEQQHPSSPSVSTRRLTRRLANPPKIGLLRRHARRLPLGRGLRGRRRRRGRLLLEVEGSGHLGSSNCRINSSKIKLMITLADYLIFNEFVRQQLLRAAPGCPRRGGRSAARARSCSWAAAGTPWRPSAAAATAPAAAFLSPPGNAPPHSLLKFAARISHGDSIGAVDLLPFQVETSSNSN